MSLLGILILELLFKIFPLAITTIIPAFILTFIFRKLTTNQNKPLPSFKPFALSLTILAIIGNIVWEVFVFNNVYYEWDRFLLPYSFFFHEKPSLFPGGASWIASEWTLQSLNWIWLSLTFSIYIISILIALYYGKGRVNYSQYKKIIFLSIVPFITLSLIGLIYLSPTSETKLANQATVVGTENWKTYTNTKNGYSLKYPSTWTATEHGAPAFGADVTLLPSGSVFPQAYISIQTYDNPQNLSMLDFIKEEILLMPQDKTIEQWDTNHSMKEILVDNQKGVFRYPKRAGEGSWEVFVPYGTNKIYRIDLIPQNDVISMQTFNQILTTFKFTRKFTQ